MESLLLAIFKLYNQGNCHAQRIFVLYVSGWFGVGHWFGYGLYVSIRK
ncbi:hypothetical protein VPUCM_p0032 (plasmid) [Vibrio parahaemolyticus UCM-V493]|nr:hypothetical protein VPUCM_p0032 [Vibrio parahaemolyticus UCM-V493]